MTLVYNGAAVAWMVVSGTLLANCESKAPTTSAPVHNIATSVATPSSITQRVRAPYLDTTVTKTPNKLTEDVPELNQIAFEEVKRVAPGIEVVLKSIPRADTAIVRDPYDIKVSFTIRDNKRIIYRDTANGMTYDFSEQPEIRNLYPLWIPNGTDAGELLVAFDNRPSKELVRRFHIVHSQIVRIDTIVAFNGRAKDVDKDGLLEYAGFYDFGESWNNEQGKRYVMYVPTLYYEVRPTGLVLDSTLTKRKVKEEYGVFLGYHDSSEPGILYDKLPKGSPKR